LEGLGTLGFAVTVDVKLGLDELLGRNQPFNKFGIYDIVICRLSSKVKAKGSSNVHFEIESIPDGQSSGKQNT